MANILRYTEELAKALSIDYKAEAWHHIAIIDRH
jgi:hypothetical protein